MRWRAIRSNMTVDQKLLAIYANEAAEHLSTLNASLLQLFSSNRRVLFDLGALVPGADLSLTRLLAQLTAVVLSFFVAVRIGRLLLLGGLVRLGVIFRSALGGASSQAKDESCSESEE